ncbi:hypothetical protein AXK58_25200 [Tsukamurella tyrosinosolvens]|nr:hypothetical protein AXK58_25200 [Tsukamurella tyrosinosolvens]
MPEQQLADRGIGEAVQPHGVEAVVVADQHSPGETEVGEPALQVTCHVLDIESVDLLLEVLPVGDPEGLGDEVAVLVLVRHGQSRDVRVRVVAVQVPVERASGVHVHHSELGHHPGHRSGGGGLDVDDEQRVELAVARGRDQRVLGLVRCP